MSSRHLLDKTREKTTLCGIIFAETDSRELCTQCLASAFPIQPPAQPITCRWCEREVTARGLCSKHYAQSRKGKLAPSQPTNQPYTEAEIIYLRENYASLTRAEAAANLGCSIQRVSALASKLGLRSKVQQGSLSIRHHYFSHITTPVQGYILGLLMADGWVLDDHTIGLELTEDYGPVAFTQQQLAPLKKINTRNKGGKQCYRVSFRSHQMAADLAHWGVIPRKTGEETWPKHLPATITWSFLHGYFDGDGTLSLNTATNEWHWSICCANPQFLKDALAFIHKTTRATCGKISPTNAQKTCWAFSITGRKNILELDRLMNESGEFGLKRKRLTADSRRDIETRIQKHEEWLQDLAASHEQIISHFGTGKLTKEIAEITGKSETMIRRVRREANISPPPRPTVIPWNKGTGKEKEPSQAEKRRYWIAELIEAGYSDREIAREVECDIHTAWNIRKRLRQRRSMHHGA